MERAGVCVLLAAVWLVNSSVLFYKVTRARVCMCVCVCVCVCVLVKFRRCFLLYDDGSLADQERREAFTQGQIVKADVLRCGFLLSDAEAIGIYELCMRHFICLEVQKIPRELNEKAY